MTPLSEIQTAFAEALSCPEHDVPAEVASGRRRFDVYRNNRAVNLVGSLRATFPAVEKLVGETYFNAAARAFIDVHPPRTPVLLGYGERFGDFLDGLPSAARVPYLGDVARLESARARALHAADADAVGVEALGHVPGEVVENVTFALHPSTALVASRWPVVSVWRACMQPDDSTEVDMTRAECVLVVRPAMTVAVYALPTGCNVLLETIGAGLPLGEAARCALVEDADFDLASGLRFIFDAGVVCSVKLEGAPDHEQQRKVSP